jgi:Rrf2 family protein
MKVTALEEYGMRCLVQLTRAYKNKEPLTIPDIASAEGLSTPYVGKIMSTLRSGGLVSSVRGRAGGYTLSRNPRAITLDETLTVLGGRLFTSNYCDKYHGSDTEDCVHTNDCTLRPVWGSIELIVGSVLKHMSLEDLLENEGNIRHSLAEALSASFKENLGRERALVGEEK